MADHTDFDVDSVCPVCRAVHNGMANFTDDRHPADGAVNLCIYCGGISIYDGSVPTKLRFPTDHELRSIEADEDIIALRWAYKQLGPPRR
jgi:hypothetical protein